MTTNFKDILLVTSNIREIQDRIGQLFTIMYHFAYLGLDELAPSAYWSASSAVAYWSASSAVRRKTEGVTKPSVCIFTRRRSHPPPDSSKEGAAVCIFTRRRSHLPPFAPSVVCIFTRRRSHLPPTGIDSMEQIKQSVASYLMMRFQIDTLMLIVLITMFVYTKKRISRNNSLTLSQRINSVSLRRDALERIIGVGDRNCIWELRMNVNAFAILCELLKVKGGLTEDGRVSIAEQIIIFLIILGHHKKNRSLQVRFYRSGETISRYFNRVLYSIIRVQSLLFAKAEPVLEGCVDPRWKWFKGCLGALDGTYIDVSVPEADKPRFRTRKGRISTNVLGVCNRDMNFVYVLSGWEGSASDSRILRDAIGRRNSLQIPLGSYYLVDVGYTNGQGFLAPYRGTRYHVQEWAQGSRAPQNYQEYFNKKHSSARNIIERCFGLLKKRWTILRSPSFYPIKTQNRIIIACCLLQNFIRMNMDSDPEENTTIEPEHMPVGEDFSNVEVIESVESSNEWTQRRETLAIEMFEEWRRNRTAF
ncbi:uncharacterized protein LOC141848319 [Curcuma longa]|uniref:uncharacterized protein LOC141848319 n=1 Tax=Curcuma longa TaxID=136217 RepID=UPI003D9F3366